MRRTWLPVLSLALGIGLAAAHPAARADDDKAAAPVDRKAFDQTLYKTLKDVINRGADLYNSGDRNGCYRLYEGSLVTLGPLLDHRPEWQKLIGDSLADAQRNASIGQRAFVLRGVLDKIRSDINPKKPDVGTKAPPLIGSPGAPPSVPPGTGGSPAGKTLWDRLGGEPTVTKVIDDFVDLAATDIKVNFDRDGKYKLEPTAVAAFKKQMVAFASSATGGPIKYEGKNMKDAHKDMGITEAEFNALAADLKRALEKNGVKPDEAKAVLDLVESTRKDIVQPK